MVFEWRFYYEVILAGRYRRKMRYLGPRPCSGGRRVQNTGSYAIQDALDMVENIKVHRIHDIGEERYIDILGGKSGWGARRREI